MTKHLVTLQEFSTWPRQHVANRIVIADAKMCTIEMSGHIKALKAALCEPVAGYSHITRPAERHLRRALGGVGN